MTTDQTPPPRITVYTDAIAEYLDAQTWLTAADAPLKVHAQQLARSLDQQLNAKGEIQSALASSFDKVMVRLDARRPKPVAGPQQLDGQLDIFSVTQTD
ncbi:MULTISPECIES: hypothetical protein [unclassified Aeromicrobium]|uniref:hypothetical protein n=1 Tax=unclassified Aeromicrobium TaxID=2633570 RepID=UPI00288C03A6|nr:MULTISPECIES: hypothetical protein [unclassified Aeromicrobium]